ncbi:MAG: NUDIX hydrolase [Moraxellaceae bacterium]|nr:MAG: NUDIX hydrolase [Moraxellaceae bacterium]
MCKRAIEPRKGFWTLPAGYMENGESTQQGAARETWEEAEAKVQNVELYTLFNLPHINQVYMFFRAEVVDGKFGNGSESLETKLMHQNEIPWDELAFPTVRKTLELFFDDRLNSEYPVRVEDIHYPPRR